MSCPAKNFLHTAEEPESDSQSPVTRGWEWLCAPENGGGPPGPTGQPGNPSNEVQAPGLVIDRVLTNVVECGGGQPHPHHTQEKSLQRTGPSPESQYSQGLRYLELGRDLVDEGNEFLEIFCFTVFEHVF